MDKVDKNIYELTITGKQAETLQRACELYERLHAGQWFALEDILPFKEGVHPTEFERAMKEYIEPLIDTDKLFFERVSGDLMSVIRHRLSWDREPQGGSTVAFQAPMQLGSEPLAVIERNNGWMNYSTVAPSDDGYFMAFCPDYSPSVQIARYDADLGGWLEFSDEEVTHWKELPGPPKMELKND